MKFDADFDFMLCSCCGIHENQCNESHATCKCIDAILPHLLHFSYPVCLKFSTEDIQKNLLIVSFVKTGGANAILFFVGHKRISIHIFTPLLSSLDENLPKRSQYNAAEHY